MSPGSGAISGAMSGAGDWRQLFMVLAAVVTAVLLLSWYQLSFRVSMTNSEQALRISAVERLAQSFGAEMLATDSRIEAPTLVFDPALQWKPVDLPHDWLLEGGRNAIEHYRYSIELNVPPDRLWAIMLTRVNLNAAVYVNGRLVGFDGRLREPITHNWSRPLLFSIPSGLLSVGSNEILLQVVSLPAGHGNLGPFLLGPREVLAPLYDRQHFYDVQLPRFLTVLSTLLTLVIGGIWLLRRQDTEYAWFALTMAFWTLYSLKFHVSDIPVSSLFWAWALSMGSIGAAYPLYFYLQRLEGRTRISGQRVMLLLWLGAWLLITALMLMRSPLMYPAANICYPISLLIALYGLVRISLYAMRTKSTEARWIAATISFMLVFIVYDMILIFGYSNRASGELTAYVVPLFLLTFGMLTLRRFVNALAEREDLLAHLETRAQAAAERIVSLEKQTALAEQRETIMRDMHDGVGGHLVSSLAILDQAGGRDGEVLKNALQGALTDLRLMMDSLDGDFEDLNLLLGALRDRMQPILKSAGLASHWQLAELPLLVGLDAHQALQILRVLQEAITNTIRHAQARTITVSAQFDHANNQIRFEVTDDGTGMQPDGTHRGRGLENMRHRARSLGGMLHLQSEPGCGSSVCLILPGPDQSRIESAR